LKQFKYIVKIYMNYKKILLTAVIVLILDFMVLKILGFGDIFIKMLNKIQGKTKTKILGALLAYSILIFHIYYFVIKPKLKMLDAFLLGFATYAIYDFTNYTLLNEYSLKIGIMDSLWGGILYTLTNYIVNK